MSASRPSAVLVAWGNAWLAGHVGLDEAVDVVERLHGPQTVHQLPVHQLPVHQLPVRDLPVHELPLRVRLARLRAQGLASLRLALPAPGDPLGLTGPAQLNEAAIEAGEAV